MGKGVTQNIEELKKFNTPRENGFEGFEDRLDIRLLRHPFNPYSIDC